MHTQQSRQTRQSMEMSTDKLDRLCSMQSKRRVEQSLGSKVTKAEREKKVQAVRGNSGRCKVTIATHHRITNNEKRIRIRSLWIVDCEFTKEGGST